MIVSIVRRWFIVLLIAASCSSEPARTKPPEAWGTADYVKAGLPALEATWTGADHARAAAVIADAVKADPARLPRYEGKQSGAVFAKLAAPVTAAGSLDDQLRTRVAHFEATNALSKLYAAQPPQREYIELIGALLAEAAALTDLIDPFLATIPPDDPSMPARREGLRKMILGWTGILWGATFVAADRRVPAGDRAALIRYVAKAMPVLFPRLEADAQAQIRRELSDLDAALDAGPLKDAVEAALSAAR